MQRGAAPRLVLLVAAIAASWWALGGVLGSLDEAFWLLAPAWALAGIALEVLPVPRLPVQGRWKRAAVGALLVCFPAGVYLFMAGALGGRVSPAGGAPSLYFFSLSPERG